MFTIVFVWMSIWLTACAQEPASNETPRLLTSVKELNQLLQKNDTNDYQVDLKAHVNYWDRSWKSLFVQDGDDAVFVEMSSQAYSRIHELSLGDLVQIKGRFNPTRYVVQAGSVEKLSSGEPAKAMKFDIANAQLGSHWSRRVEVKGVVESVLVGLSRLQLVMRSGRRRFWVLAKVAPESETPQAGATVLFTGTLAYLTDKNDMANVYLVHQMPADKIEILQPAATETQTTTVSDFPSLYKPNETDDVDSTLYEVHGQVTYIHEYDFVIIENKQRQSLLVYAPFYDDLHTGDVVRIIGTRSPTQLPNVDEHQRIHPQDDSLGLGTHLVANRIMVVTTAPVPPAPAMVHNLLGFSRQSDLSMKPSDINDVVRQTCALLEHSVDEKYNIQIDLAPDLHRCMIDENQVIQVLLNLSINARDAMAPEGGEIQISTSNVSADEWSESPLSVKSQETPNVQYVKVSIADNGDGIPKELHDKIFEPFFTTKPAGQGTGLGLAMSKGIIEQHGGDIMCSNRPSKGVCFAVFLPAID